MENILEETLKNKFDIFLDRNLYVKLATLDYDVNKINRTINSFSCKSYKDEEENELLEKGTIETTSFIYNYLFNTDKREVFLTLNTKEKVNPTYSLYLEDLKRDFLLINYRFNKREDEKTRHAETTFLFEEEIKPHDEVMVKIIDDNFKGKNIISKEEGKECKTLLFIFFSAKEFLKGLMSALKEYGLTYDLGERSYSKLTLDLGNVKIEARDISSYVSGIVNFKTFLTFKNDSGQKVEIKDMKKSYFD